MLQIDLYTEITCPWCFIGTYRLDKVLAELFPSLGVSIHHHPVLLLDAPKAGLYIPDMLQKRYGVTDSKEVFSRPEGEARPSGLNLDMSRQLTHALIEAAGKRGTQHRRVEEAAAKSTAAGIRSVPHFVFGNSIVINGGRSKEEIA